MIKQLTLSIAIELIEYPGQVAASIAVRPAAVKDLTLGLCLLRETLIERLLIVSEATDIRLDLSAALSPQEALGARLEQRKGTMRIQMNSRNLEYLQHFFLRYCRDGLAEVDHVDLEAISGQGSGANAYITFKVFDSRPSLSPKEADEWLGS
jgi:hypothetical protein